MAQNDVLEVGADWVQLTDTAATNFTCFVRSGPNIEIMGTNGAVAPTATAEPQGITVELNTGVINKALSDLFPGVTGVDRLYARITPLETENALARVFISHA